MWGRGARITNSVVSWAGVALLTVFVAEAGWVRWALGRWPAPYRDEAPGIIGGILDAATAIGIQVVVLGIPVWLVSLYVVWRSNDVRLAKRNMLLFLSAVFTLGAFAVWNPFRFPEWWLD